MKETIFASLEPVTVGYAAFMATLISLLHTWSTRNRQAFKGEKLSPWRTVIPDVLIGTITGSLAAIGLPEVWPKLHSFTGVSLIAGAGGVLGPKIWDLISSNGISLLLDYLAGTVTGPLGKWAQARQVDADTSPPTAPTSPPAVTEPLPPLPQEAGDHDESQIPRPANPDSQ